MSRNSGQWMWNLKKNCTEMYLHYLINILMTLRLWTFSPNLGVYEKPFLKLLVQVTFPVNGMQLRELSFFIRFRYLLSIGDRIIIAPGHTQWHTHRHTQTHTYKHTHTHTRYDSSGWPVLHRNHYPTTHNGHKTETTIPPARFEPAIPASERPQNHTLDHANTAIGAKRSMKVKYKVVLAFN